MGTAVDLTGAGDPVPAETTREGRCSLPICIKPLENRETELLCIEQQANPVSFESLHPESLPEKDTAAWW